jgi:hypothetical protein
VYSSERAFNFQAGICIRANVTIEREKSLTAAAKKSFVCYLPTDAGKKTPGEEIASYLEFL